MKGWTIEKLDRMTRELAGNGVTEQEVRHALIAMHGHPERGLNASVSLERKGRLPV